MHSTAPIRPIQLRSAAFIAIANMIGTGVFTSLGYQVLDISSVFALILLWVVGGIVALCGALAYGELGAALPRSGGEYHLLGRIYHPSIGFLSGWVSATAGFAAPTAIAAIALGKYTQAVFPAWEAAHTGAVVVLLTTLVHGTSIRFGMAFQDGFTCFKLLVILLLIIAGFALAMPQDISLVPRSSDWGVVVSPAFAIALVYVSYAYTGWNASIYLVGEMKDPQKNLPKALLFSTLLVMLLYALLHYVFLYTVAIPDLAGKIEIGFIVGQTLFGEGASAVLSLLIALLMVSTVSAMVFLGARINQVMGEDYQILRFMARRSRQGMPVPALLIQTGITLLFIYSASFEQVIVYASFTLMLLTSLTVAGVYVLRWREPTLHRPYRVWGFPITPAIFLGVNLWIMGYVVLERPGESLLGLAIIAAGAGIFWLNQRWKGDASEKA